jgi:Domain of unknown function (DUF4189)
MTGTSFRTPAAIWAAGAAVVATLTVAVTPAAHADSTWGTLAVGAGGKWGISYGEPSKDQARSVALNRCNPGCNVTTFTDGPGGDATANCAVVFQITGERPRLAWAYGATREEVEVKAAKPDSKELTWACNNPPGSGPVSSSG